MKKKPNFLEFLLNYTLSLLPLVFSLIIAFLFFENRNLLIESDVYFDDYPRHIFKAYILWYNNISQFHSIFGFYSNLYSGIPMIQFYPIGMFFIMNFFHFLGFSYSTSLKITIGIAFVLVAYCPYWICRLYDRPRIFGVFASFWLMFAINSLIYNLFVYGMIPFILASCLTVLFLAVLGRRKFDNAKSKDLFVTPMDYLLFALFVSGILINYMSIIFAGAAMALYLVFLFASSKNNTINYVRYSIKLTLVAILVTGFWLIPTISIQFFEIDFNYEAIVFGYDSALEFMNEYHRRNLLWMVIMIPLIFVRGVIQIIRKDRFEVMLYIIFILGLFAAYILPFFNLPLFMGINSYRYIFFYEIITSVLLIFMINPKKIKEDFKTIIQHLKKTQTADTHEDLGFLLSKLVFTLSLICLSFVNLMPQMNPANNFQGFVFSLHRMDTGGAVNIPIDYSYLDSDLRDIIDWIKQNTDNSSRILFQDSGEESGHMISGGHNLCLVALYTNRYYANGHLSHNWYKYGRNSTFLDDELFGRDLRQLDQSFLFGKLESFNIEYIITWSELAKEIFLNFSLQTGSIAHIAQVGKFEIFQITNASKNFISVPYAEFSWEPSRIQFKAFPTNQTAFIMFKSHDFPNWKVKVNGIFANKIQDQRNLDNLIMFEIPHQFQNSEEIFVEIFWQVSFIENASSAISVISVLCIAGFKWRESFFDRIKKWFRKY